MRRIQAPPEGLAALAALGGITFGNGNDAVAIRKIDDDNGRDDSGKNYGTVALRDIEVGSEDESVLMTVPRDLVLSLENVWISAKADRDLLMVLEAVGDFAKGRRLELTHNATDGKVGNAGFFTEYVKFLPGEYTLPTFWDEDERNLLQGTSLEAALASKLNSLDREFTLLRDKTSTIDWCRQHWWDLDTGLVSFQDWLVVDAMYRSRALDLPGTGHATVPFIDMANHASGDETVALYETDSDGNAILLLRSGKFLRTAAEVTITYGDEKGACEMVFSYGFLEQTMDSARELFLELTIPDTDPLKLAKQKVANCAPGFRLFEKDGAVEWEGPYIWLLCVNEEDGLDFQVLQTTTGERELQASWCGNEVKDMSVLPKLIEDDPKRDVIHLRAVSILQSRLEEQLIRLENSKVFLHDSRLRDSFNYMTAMKLRDLEETLMLHAYDDFEEQKSRLTESTVVRAYLASVQQQRSTQALEEKDNLPTELEEDDFA